MEKLKNYLKYVLLFTAIIFSTVSCQKEDDPNLNEISISNESLRVETVSKAFIEQYAGVKEKLEALKNKNNSKDDYTLQRNVYNEEFDLNIDTESAIYIENGNSHSFTFSAYSSSNINNTIINIVLFFNPSSQEYVVNKVEYTISNQELLNFVEENSSNYNFDKISIKQLNEFDTNSLFNRNNNSTGIYTRSDGTCYHIENVERILIGDEEYYIYDEVTVPCQGGEENIPHFDQNDGGGYTFIDIIYVYNPDTGEYEEWTPDGSTTGGNSNGNTSTGNNTNPNTGAGTTPLINVGQEVVNALGIPTLGPNANIDLYNWITNRDNSLAVNEIYAFLLENDNSIASKTFASELFTIMQSETVIDTDVLNFTLEAFNQDKIYNNFDHAFLSSVNQYMAIDTSDESLTDPIAIHILMKMALIRALNPDICAGLSEWRCDVKVFWEATKDVVHIVLDGIGLVPVVGEVADLINGGLYLLEGDGVNATLSFAATVPIAGWTATGTKYAIKIVDASQTASVIATKVQLTWKVVGNAIDWGSNDYCRKQLRKVLNLTNSTIHAHHIIPLNFKNNPIVQKAAKSGNAFHINEELNGFPIPSSTHLTGHNLYNNKIESILNYLQFTNPNMTPNQAYNHIQALNTQIKSHLINNPGFNLGQISNLIIYP